MSDDIVFRRVSAERQSLASNQIPRSLRALIPYAERYGDSELCHRGMAFQRANQQELAELRLLLKRHCEELAEWLDENCRQGPPYPAAHARFSALRMLADTWQS